jgi:hypothetical protein
MSAGMKRDKRDMAPALRPAKEVKASPRTKLPNGIVTRPKAGVQGAFEALALTARFHWHDVKSLIMRAAERLDGRGSNRVAWL